MGFRKRYMLANLVGMLNMDTEPQLLQQANTKRSIFRTRNCHQKANLENKSLILYDRGFQLEIFLTHIFHRHYGSGEELKKHLLMALPLEPTN